MTLVTKKISGHKYLYYQDSVNNGTKNVVISTYVGRDDISIEKLENAKLKAMNNHLVKICKIQNLIRQVPYHFEHNPTLQGINIDYLEYLRLTHEIIMKSLTAQEMEEAENTFFIKYVHGTTVIEGNTLSESEVGKLLTTGLTSQNKTINETLEVANYNALREYLENYTGEINERLVRTINKILMNRLVGRDGKPIQAGEYRRTRALIAGIGYTPPPPEAIEKQMLYLLDEYNSNVKNHIHPIETTARFHQKFEEIHPFQDGNGRTGRALVNLMLKRAGFPRIYITEQQRGDYLDALEAGNIGEYSKMIDFLITRIIATLVFYYTKTSIYNLVTSYEFKQQWSSFLGTELFTKLRHEIINQHNSKNLP